MAEVREEEEWEEEVRLSREDAGRSVELDNVIQEVASMDKASL